MEEITMIIYVVLPVAFIAWLMWDSKRWNMDDFEKKVIYYYRNNFPVKKICEITGRSYKAVQGKIDRLKKKGTLKRWWEE